MRRMDGVDELSELWAWEFDNKIIEYLRHRMAWPPDLVKILEILDEIEVALGKFKAGLEAPASRQDSDVKVKA